MIHSSLTAANEYSRCSTSAELTMAKDRVASEPPHATQTAQFLGSALEARAHDPSLNASLAKFRPGMWVRIRNLHLDSMPTTSSGGAEGSAVYASIHADTHVCLLYPYFQ